jgi:hypothetical protein
MWRFGQKHTVNVNIIVADNELPILETLQHKKDQHDVMKKAMQKAILQAKKK